MKYVNQFVYGMNHSCVCSKCLPPSVLETKVRFAFIRDAEEKERIYPQQCTDTHGFFGVPPSCSQLSID